MARAHRHYDGRMTGAGRHLIVAIAASLVLAACGSLPPRDTASAGSRRQPEISDRAREVVIFALGLIDTGYRFGGKNPEAGLDCSGMVSYVFNHAAGIRLSGSAADIARLGRPVDAADLRPGDLVFFNTLNRSHSHVGIYVGDGRFVHAPSSQGRVRTDELNQGWFASRFEEARSYLN
jgi:cell wall-associated NlpC family hydrolase